MLWLAITFPTLALDILGLAAHDTAPLAIEDHSRKRLIIVCNASAHALGIHAGQTSAAAQALSDELRLLAQNTDAEKAALERIANSMLAFTSWVGVMPPRTVLLEVQASQRLFGGLSVLCKKVLKRLHDLGYQASAAVAPTPSAARLLANAGQQRIVQKMHTLQKIIEALPLSISELAPSAISGLSSVGVHDFAALMKLPRAETARRFGKTVPQYLDCLFARLAEPVIPFRAAETFSADIELAYAVERGEALLFPLKRLLRELCAWLVTRQLLLLRGDIILRHQQTQTSINLGLVRASGDAEHLFKLAQTQIERLQLPAPVLFITLHAIECTEIVAEHADLFSANEREDITRVVERLRARLGDSALSVLSLCAEHRPELAMQKKNWQRGERNAQQISTSAPRPLLILEAPEPLRTWLHKTGAATSFSYAERIESGWWDGLPVVRDYYRLDTENGVRLWVFQERALASEWLVHGVFA